MSGRDWGFVLLGAAGAGVITMAFLMSGSVSSPETALAAGPSGAAPVAARVTEVKASPVWTAANSSHWVEDIRTSVAFDLPADNRVQVWTRTVQPTLVVRCVSRAIDVFVVTESAAKIESGTDDHTVRYQIDGEAEVTERWADSVDHDVLFAPDGGSLAARLARASSLRFGFTPHNAAPVVAQFSVAGLAALIESAAAKCSAAPPR